MKIFIISLVISGVLFIILQSFTIMSSKKAEEQAYTIIKSFPDFEIRFYPAAFIATVNSDAKTYKELSGPGFQKLAGYIFGGNATAEKISMTSPVHMDINDSGSSMSFVMPSGYSENNLPAPNDSGVRIKKTGEEYVAVIRFGGFASDNDLQFYAQKLQVLLDAQKISTHGHFRFLGYNPPFQVVNRRNEIVVAVNWKPD